MSEKMTVTELTEEQAKAEMKKAAQVVNTAPIITAAAEPETIEESEGFIDKCIDFVKGGGFKRKVQEISEESGVPSKVVAKNFLQKVLGTIGDGAELVGSTLEDLCSTFLSILHFVLNKAVEFIVKAAKFIFRLLTFNYTCIE